MYEAVKLVYLGTLSDSGVGGEPFETSTSTSVPLRFAQRNVQDVVHTPSTV